MRLLSLLLAISISASALSLSDINDKAPSRAKNFLIWQYLQQDISSDQADLAFYQIKDVNRKLFLTYAKKSAHKEVQYTSKCMRYSLKEFQDSDVRDVDCIRLSMSPYKFSKLSLEKQKYYANQLSPFKAYSWTKMMFKDTDLKSSDMQTYKEYLRIYNGAGKDYRRTKFNQSLSPEFIEKLSTNWAFSQFVKLSVTDKKLSHIHSSLLSLQNDKLSAQTLFFLGLNALNLGKNRQAYNLFEKSKNKAYFRHQKDKASFWQYQALKDKNILKKLSEQVDINVYTLYAAEEFHKIYTNYFITLNEDRYKKAGALSDPFKWNEILTNIKATPKERLYLLASDYNAPEELPVKAFIVERASGYMQHNFILPYQEYMKDLNVDQRATMLSLMRQESHFIPAALSRSYALGLMQMMPFLVKILDKKMDDKMESLNDMFEPERNIKYATKHIAYLEKYLFHPLFIAYAYNGGMGFTKRLLLDNTFTEGPYEPFMSMEMIANTESREYGKKVLSNYVMYKRILGQRISIHTLFDRLLPPFESDYFRKRALAQK